MEIKVTAGDISGIPTEAVILGQFEGAEHPEGALAAADLALGGAVSRLIKQGEIKGKSGEVTIIHSLGKLSAARLAVAGLGKKEELTADKVRRIVGEVCRTLQRKHVSEAAISAIAAGNDAAYAAQTVVEGAILGTYTFRRHMTKEDNGELKQLTVAGPKTDLSALQEGSRRGKILAEATNLARDLVNEPANFMTPSRLAEIAAGLAKDYGLGIEVLEREQMAQMGMGALLGVAQGSDQPPKFIVLSYRGGNAAAGFDLALVGKGITFDSGGLDIKTAEWMDDMKADMAGAASVMTALSVIAQLKPGINVVAIAPCTENLPSGRAFKPGDVLTAMNGKTIEIISTDAEGRLILADALCYANKLGVKRIVDIATLTGACHVALGDDCSGVFGYDQETIDRVLDASKNAGDLMWQLPLYEHLKEQIKSPVADLKNSGGRYGGAITAAQFLGEFVDKTPWVHIDIAGPSMSDKEWGYMVKGATGVPVRTLVSLALSLAAKESK
jgi:leucyl aminopeptidase